MLSTNVHDWHLANEILKTVLDYADKNGLKNITKIEIELGSILDPPASPAGSHGGQGHGEYISPENLIYNFKLLAKKTIAKNAELKIKKIPARHCKQGVAGGKGDEWKLIEIEGLKPKRARPE